MSANDSKCLPAPLVSAEVDLTDFNFMKLDVRRLRDSRIALSVTGEEFRCAVLLWCAAWHQRPAASLPDNDAELAQLAGFGRAVVEWKKVREGALYGWIRCSDGRLYHRVVADKAVEAWNEKIEYRWRRECDRIRKKQHLADGGVPLPPRPNPVLRNATGEQKLAPLQALRKSAGNEELSHGNSALSDGTADIPRGNPERSGGFQAENALKGEGEVRDINNSAEPSSALPFDTTSPPPSKVSDQEADLYRRGKVVLGNGAGGLIKKLVRAKSGSISLARAAIETASEKAVPREYIGAIIKVRDSPDDLRARGEAW